MADKLNQVGKSLGKMRADSEAALRRAQPSFPTVERSRDVFDFSSPFEMRFKIAPNQKKALLDLVFQKPPPDCLGGEWALKCEQFIFTGGDHLIQLSHSYEPKSISVFINDFQLSTSQFDEVDPSSGLVFVQGVTGDEDIVVCYFYGCACKLSASLFGTTGLITYGAWFPPDDPIANDASKVVDGDPNTSSAYGAGLFYPDNGSGVAERGWRIGFSCGQAVQKFNLYRHPDDGITHWPDVLWVDDVITPYTLIGAYTATADKPLGWEQWILPAPVFAGSIQIGQRVAYNPAFGTLGFTFFPWLLLNEVVFL